jgi:hypothetical protein
MSISLSAAVAAGADQVGSSDPNLVAHPQVRERALGAQPVDRVAGHAEQLGRLARCHQLTRSDR